MKSEHGVFVVAPASRAQPGELFSLSAAWPVRVGTFDYSNSFSFEIDERRRMQSMTFRVLCTPVDQAFFSCAHFSVDEASEMCLWLVPLSVL